MTRQQKTVSKILEVKGFTKEQREAEVKKASERLSAEEARLAELERECRRSGDDFAAKQAVCAVPVAQLELFYAYLKHLGKQIEQQKKIIAQRAAEHEKARLAMLEAYREQRLFELLHDKLDEEQRKEADQGEQKEADYQYLTRNDKP